MPTDGPFSGLTVLDLTRVLAGPYCTMVLSDLGARVIKIEVPEKGDDARHFGPYLGEVSAYFASLNRGKESIALNLKDDADRAIFGDLLAGADVLVENYRAGVMEKLGFGWDVLHEKYPRLIYAAVSGFGHSGPYAKRPAYDMVVQGMGGVMSLTGQPDGPPTRVGTSVGDITAGLFTAIGTASALYDRERTGTGMKIDVGMLDCQVAILENAIARFTATGDIPGPLGARHPSIVPFEAFATADGHLIIAAGNDGLFATLAKALGKPEWADDARFRTNSDRAAHVDALKREVEAVLSDEPTSHWLSLLEDAGVPCGPINNVADVLADAQVKARNMVVHTEDAEAGKLTMAGNPIKLSAYDDPGVRGTIPRLDEHRDALLRDFKK